VYMYTRRRRGAMYAGTLRGGGGQCILAHQEEEKANVYWYTRRKRRSMCADAP